MKLVRFKDGTYGIRKGNWLTGYLYKDFKSIHWWRIGIFPDDIRTTKENAEKFLDKGEIV